jgi:hypothetical protein
MKEDKTSKVIADFRNDGGEDGSNFVRLAVDQRKFGVGNVAIFRQKFKPELSFVDFLKQSIQFRAEFQ